VRRHKTPERAQVTNSLHYLHTYIALLDASSLHVRSSRASLSLIRLRSIALRFDL
jgi:hypothetical protein